MHTQVLGKICPVCSISDAFVLHRFNKTLIVAGAVVWLLDAAVRESARVTRARRAVMAALRVAAGGFWESILNLSV